MVFLKTGTPPLTVTTMLPLQGMPQDMYGAPVTLKSITVYYKVDDVSDPDPAIEQTQVFIGATQVYGDTTVRKSTSFDNYTVTIGQPVTGDVNVVFYTSHPALGAGYSVDIARVKAELAY
jgi:hypothetical protein